MVNNYKSSVSFIAILLAILIVVAGCKEEQKDFKSTNTTSNSVEEPEEESKPSDKKESVRYEVISDSPVAPEKMEDIINYPAGPFVNNLFREEEDKIEIVKELEKLPNLNGTEGEEVYEAYWNTLVQMFAGDYKDPNQLIEMLKIKSFGSPEIDDPRYQFKENLNVEILLDASGSMKAQVNGKSKMELAKEAISKFTESLPSDAKIALRVYGHKGTGSDKDKELSCKANERVFGFSNYDKDKMSSTLKNIEPKGWTPVANSLQKASEDLSMYPADQNTNIIYLVSDGIETCDGDPITAAKELKESNVKPIVNVIGFDVDAAGQKQLKEVAKSADGSYANVYNLDGLTNEFDRAKEIAEKWESWRTKALGDNLTRKVLNTSDIFQFAADWGSTNLEETNNLRGSLLYLKKNERVTGEAFNYLNEKVDERRKNILGMKKVFEEDMHNLNEANFEEMNQIINEKYNTNKE
ncbi:VWA domain-containing protein [Rossellomorea sp. SC111]|uniref:vWA domain-containing protein n=1 Tax=Rossellomorea sp. SC111 TaxID=2968985 RepID=UPI00215A8CFD|nr:VWA domain-containing protein [Rossellomorea sp. SC111]MCR8850836.1 VWA domain-containing protein [Rossellomorea sp. SC111]